MFGYDHGGDIYGGLPVRLDFSVNTNPLGLPAEVIAAVRSGAAEDGRYPDPYCRALRGALARHHGVTPERIVCGAGAADLIMRICAWLRPRRVLVPSPTFSEYARCAALFGAEIREVPLREDRGFAPDETILAALTPEIDAVFLCQPNNPTGRLWDGELLEQIVKRCRENGTHLIADECFLDFTDAPSLLPRQEEFHRLLILRAFTKFYAMAGLRLGYLICPDGRLAEDIAAYGAAWSVSAPAQRAGLAALTAPSWRERTAALVEKERRYLIEALSGMGVTVFPGAANFLLCRAEREVWKPLLERGILVRRCGNFTGLNETYFRIGIKTEAENRELIEALREVLNG